MSVGGPGSCNIQTVQRIGWETVGGDPIPWIIRIKKATYDRQRPRHTANMRVHIRKKIGLYFYCHSTQKKKDCIQAIQRRPEGHTTYTRNTSMEETSSRHRRKEACCEGGQGPEGALAP